MQAGIYTGSVLTEPIVLSASKIDIDTLYALTQKDNNLLLKAVQVGEIALPLNNASNESSFVISMGESKDTIRVLYDKQLLFKSVKCGVTYTYIITKIEHSNNLLQKIIISNSSIDVISKENIQLVF